MREGSEGGRRIPYWVEGTTPAQVARRMKVTIPARASDLRAAYQRGFQDDGVLLAFTLPKADTKAFIHKLAPESPLLHRNAPVTTGKGQSPTTPFAHLGLKEPGTLADVTEGPVCTACEGDLNWLNIAVHPVDAQHDQVYLTGAV
ncbi:hypothetical protein SRB17_30500 [Streptomyces sp. RB17]|uniref:hypothetical protein n=1 Tax=Streptomyces sp. RB17 TaxID=2585197 RepID=UPI001294E370|nr:hypothetical protein [Streptomyces sp. RB17]MQY35078.1 hypothetical protein [Streptomyces sp. RB17]